MFGELSPSELALRSGMDRSRTSKALMPLLVSAVVMLGVSETLGWRVALVVPCSGESASVKSMLETTPKST